MKFILVLVLSCLIFSCNGGDKVQIWDSKDHLATFNAVSSHELFAEFDRTIKLYSKSGTKTLPYPPDTGGDLPIKVTRHRGNENDFLMFQGGIYLLVFDLKTQDYANGSDRPENEIYTGLYRGEKLPPLVSEWIIDKYFKINKIK